MTTLVLEMRQGDLLIVNGAPIRFRNRARIELAGRARFLFGKQILTAEAATTPARRIYFALQTAYVGPEPERAGGMELARGLVEDFLGSDASEAAKALIQKAMSFAEADDSYQALKLVRRVMQQEDANPSALVLMDAL
ncbi:flagellar biosynthesis repressor FlbT [Pseudoroseomonas wenyumeiae]|uniref:Flagellar biosynthesis repressor FlbT n=1 Tax=Teichococcus wenyumeiae TaxID=2478470 RepID=A0A3A9JC51_9PROT|nr:flagellar biosynthesis repressor FlbT [Pseudoroseomonas wenyumeiae]RKK01176.1 flagellar biosynthesis repressor FlbT [Pseudoroseomonas wenyumeiae]RMI26728.1 flagellar biosynthesis repressor FlbT [Pseudoroseomonas wenyumeiae]